VRRGRYAVFVMGCGLLRLAELAYSGRNERRIRSRDASIAQADPAGFRRMVGVNVALFTLPLLEVVLRRGPRVPPAVRWAGLMGQLGAVALRLWVIASLRQRWTVRAIVPVNLDIVEGGPYRFIRHPNYLAVAIEFAALPLAGGAYVSAAALTLANAAVLRDRIEAEERLLARIPGYAERMGGKPRFIPGARATTSR
jgi:methyltransferase